MNKNLIFLVSLFSALKEEATISSDNLGYIKIFRTLPERINKNDVNSGFACAVLLTAKAYNYSFPFIITGTNPDDITNKIHSLFQSASLSLAISSVAPNISVITSANLRNKISQEISKLTPGNNYNTLFGSNQEAEEVLSSILYDSFYRATTFLNSQNININQIPFVRLQMDDLIVMDGKIYFDYGIVVVLTQVQTQQGVGVTASFELSHVLQRAAKSDYIY